MAVLRINPVSGEVPRLSAERLPDQAAGFALDCDFSHSDIRVLPVAEPYQTFQVAPRSFHLDKDGGLHVFENSAVSVVSSPVADEQYNRFYCCSPELGLRVKSEVDGELLRPGVPVPVWVDDSPLITVLNPFTDESGNEIAVRSGVGLLASVWWEDSAGTRSSLLNVSVTELSVFTGDADDLGDIYSAEFVLQAPDDEWPVVDSDLTLCASLVGMGALDGQPVTVVGSLVSSGSLRADTDDPVRVFGSSDVTGSVRFDTVSDAAGVEHEVVVFSVTLSIVDARAYVVTLVNRWGEESAPSRAVSVSLSDDEDARLQFNWDNLRLEAGYADVKSLRIYRSAITSGSLTDYFYLAEIAVAASGLFLYTDDVSASDAADDVAVLSTEDYLPAPDGLQGVGVHPSGFLFGWKGAELWVSEPYLPYAWKPGNVLVLNADIVGAVVHSGAIFCATEAYPELVNGSDPTGLLPMRLGNPQAGVGAAAIADAGNLIFASPDGLVQVSGADARLMTDHFSRSVWKSRYGGYLDQLSLVVYDGALYGVFSDIDGFVIRLDEGGACCQSSLRAHQVQYHPALDQLFLLGADALNVVGVSKVSARVESKPFRLTKPEHLSVLSLVGTGRVRAHVFADGKPVLQVDDVLSGKQAALARVPGGFRGLVWVVQLELFGDAVVTDCYLSSSVRRLRGVAN